MKWNTRGAIYIYIYTHTYVLLPAALKGLRDSQRRRERCTVKKGYRRNDSPSWKYSMTPTRCSRLTQRLTVNIACLAESPPSLLPLASFQRFSLVPFRLFFFSSSKESGSFALLRSLGWKLSLSFSFSF